MINLEIVDYSVVIAFWLAFTRILAIVMQLPMFDNKAVPMVARVLIVLTLTYAFFPYIEHSIKKDIIFMGIDNFWILTIFHTLIGLIIGFMVKAIMTTFTAAGSIITQQIGFAAIRYYDPSSSQQVGPFEKLIQWTMIVLVISSGALNPMLAGILKSFNSISIENSGKILFSTPYVLNLVKVVFSSALMLASPIIFINILVMSILGIISRMVPQMNIIMVSFAVNIGMGLLVFVATSFEFFNIAYDVYIKRLGEWYQYII